MIKLKSGDYVMLERVPCQVNRSETSFKNYIELIGPMGGTIYASRHDEDLVCITKEQYDEQLVLFKLTC